MTQNAVDSPQADPQRGRLVMIVSGLTLEEVQRLCALSALAKRENKIAALTIPPFLHITFYWTPLDETLPREIHPEEHVNWTSEDQVKFDLWRLKNPPPIKDPE